MKSVVVSGIMSAIIVSMAVFASGCGDETTCNVTDDQLVPTITITYPQDDTIFLPDTLLSDAVTIIATVENSGSVKLVQFYVDEEVIADDYSEPYEQTWFAGFWARNTQYVLRAKAIDYFNNDIWSNEVRITTSSKTEFNVTPELISPSDGLVLGQEPQDVIIEWNPVPGARGYLLKMWYDHECECHDECDIPIPNGCITNLHVTSRTSHHTGEPFGTIYWSVQAYWSLDHASRWSAERSFTCE